ncbi:PQQ-binding-like beta-propeller repeat protein [bacterium]|nr:PQQ-binding-like beta-propeller repeat protein [bacterium]
MIKLSSYRYLLFFALFVFPAGCGNKVINIEGEMTAKSHWLMPGCDAQNTGYISGNISPSPEILWRSRIKSLDPTTPAFCCGKIFIGTPIKRIFILDADDGEIFDKIWTDAPTMYPPVISGENMIFLGYGRYNKIGIYNLHIGKTRWTKNCGDAKIFPQLSDSLVIFATIRGFLYALSLNDGKKMWQYNPGAPVQIPMAMRNDTIWCAAGNEVFCITTDGKPIWREKTSKTPIGAITLTEDRIIVPLSPNKILSLKCNSGNILWEFTAENFSNLPVATDGKIAVAVERNGYVESISNADGSLIWRTKIGRTIVSAAIIVGDKAIAASYDGGIFVIGLNNGKILSIIDCGQPVRNPPASNGKGIFVVSQNGYVFYLQ